MPIRLLPPQLANQIAAGEVVERPASVVKELMENSLDAGADEIRIDIEKGGARRIRIRDNGAGIPKDELTLALSRHATSKISSLDDLEAILSLGFRGEALASISSVSRLRLTSRTPDQPQAWQAFCEGREMQVRIEPAAHPQGTSVDVEDLFFNTPARRKFLRTEKTEFAHIDEVVRRIALARPDVTVILTHNQQVVRQYPAATEKAEKRLLQVAGRRFAEESIAVQSDDHGLSLRGWFAPPSACRHQGDLQYMYVNGRMMRDKLLNHAIRQAYGDSLPADRQPTFILYLTLPAKDVDVNVHPAKHEVRFHFARQIHDFVLATLQRALRSFATEHAETEIFQHGYQSFDNTKAELAKVQSVDVVASHTSSAQQSAAGFSPFFPARKHHQLPLRADAREGQAAYHAMYQQTKMPNADAWNLVAVLSQRYALLRHTDSLSLLDMAWLTNQVTQVRLRQQFDQGLPGQPLLVPVLVQDRDVVDTMERFPNVLARLGIVTRKEGRSKRVIEQVPSVLRRADVSRAMTELCEILRGPEVLSDRELPPELASSVLSWLGGYHKYMSVLEKDIAGLLREAEQFQIDWHKQLIGVPWEQIIQSALTEQGDRIEDEHGAG